jgi:hypothetical protein
MVVFFSTDNTPAFCSSTALIHTSWSPHSEIHCTRITHACWVHAPRTCLAATQVYLAVLLSQRNGTGRVSQGEGLSDTHTHTHTHTHTRPDDVTGCFDSSKEDPGPRCPPPNYQTLYLCGYDQVCSQAMKGSASGTDGYTALAMAKRNLERFAVIGTSDDLGAFVDQLTARLPNWFSKSAAANFTSTGGATKRHNAEVKRPDVVSYGAWQRVARENHLDEELYAYAKQRAREWTLSCSRR